MARLNRVCFTCGKKHSYCPTCYDDRLLETWHIMFDTENCKKIFNIVNQHFYKHITTDDAIKHLETCDLSKIDEFNGEIKIQVKEILANKQVVEVTKEDSYKTNKYKKQ